ncbi:NAD(P)-dependent dehydrogenase (short-subunit alcohol dehydrogenase family) [Arthrobacter sp. PvP102]|uniref:SDR family NAD(P)-dependent oxidoreductase n=1 Tax=unclassified Arthrobacter TaxID=235627 RepID=UPI001AE8CD96|nr:MULTISPECIES: SDR family NAD(P)-dependent oxidoreductase [unclassified Arthrobacter]MBP1234573.1 NAD(P)-dependent dehydrogenase (short-subunit alcohol dehydrogenase family) [Arthrobacter sp. PvP103]MBP1235531.1 NAD(P)-dependent dehydrogenase (short-subunit alcohol dehydrogenase family) [Arthrobacter sp. PvP102]
MAARTIVITGASDGIGASAARTLAKAGEQVVVVGRSAEKTRAVAQEIGADYFVSDFADLSQVRALVVQLKEKYPRIDVLANNAGGIMGKRELTVDGHEKTFQVNHLAPFLLTTELMDVLTASNATVINTSSAANAFGYVDINDLEAAGKYSTNKAYGTSKLENILFTTELHHRYNNAGISTAAFHPGGVATNFAAESTSWFRFAYKTIIKRFMLTPEQGADTLVWLATAKPGRDWMSGAYYAKRALAKANKQAYDAELARRLWDRSEVLVSTDKLNQRS